MTLRLFDVLRLADTAHFIPRSDLSFAAGSVEKPSQWLTTAGTLGTGSEHADGLYHQPAGSNGHRLRAAARRSFFLAISIPTMKCMIITPLGPGHESVAAECRQSVRAAAAASSGPFSDVFHLIVDDRHGAMGRSAARNHGIAKAREAGAEWLFFLDADDLMWPSAFAAFQKYASDYEAVWGMICEMPFGDDHAQLRTGQLVATGSFRDIVSTPPHLSLQIGHFVKTSLAESIQFNAAMDCGEDFDFYCREWTSGRCIKASEVFFINRRGHHSIGPRSANGQQWLNAAEKVLDMYRQRLGHFPLNFL